MAKYALSRRAASDLVAIYAYTARQFGRAQAVLYKSSMAAALTLLAENPVMGRVVEHLRQTGIRRHEHESHIIFYKSGVGSIDVLRVLPARSDWKDHL